MTQIADLNQAEIAESINSRAAQEANSDDQIHIIDYISSVEEQNQKIEDLAKERNKQLTLQDILKKLSRNERGDAELFLEIYKDKYVFDSSEGKSGEFYFWNGIHWQDDREKQRYRDMEAVSKYYEWAASQLNEDKQQEKKGLRDRAYSLRSAKRCKSVFEFISTEIPFKGEWDQCPGRLPCKNGVIDLKTGALFPPNSKDFIRTVCPTAYNETAHSHLFDGFLDDITLGDKELKEFLGRILGAAIFGDGKEEKIFIFYGKDGRNGKGTLMQTLERVLGKTAKTFPSEMLLLQRNPPSSSSPSPELANLQGVRIAIFSEINKGRKIDSSKVKNLSGRDTIPCRRLYSNVDLEIKPSHTMIIQTNFKPEAPADDNALWKRNILFPFRTEFVETPTEKHHRKIDESFKDKLPDESEGILAWLINSCLAYQKNGLSVPESVRRETEKYRKENDGISAFIEERCNVDSTFRSQSKTLIDEIKMFCQEEGYNVPTVPDIKSHLEKQFERKHTKKGSVWLGLSIKPMQEFDE